MTTVFYLAALVAVLATVLAITRRHAVHALLYLIVSLLASAVLFFTLGAPFAAALEVIVYAGAIVVLLLFVVMLLDVRPAAVQRERRLLRPAVWFGPAILSLALAVELVWAVGKTASPAATALVAPQAVGAALLGRYLLGVELASMLLLAGLVAAFHLGRPEARGPQTTGSRAGMKEGPRREVRP